jgi:hypothetical protein
MLAHLYRITYVPTGLQYYGSTWNRHSGPDYLKRYREHLAGKRVCAY